MAKTFTLEDNEYQALIVVLSQAQGPGISWGLINPLLSKLTVQGQTGGGNGAGLDTEWSGGGSEDGEQRPAGRGAVARPAKEGRA